MVISNNNKTSDLFIFTKRFNLIILIILLKSGDKSIRI